MAASPSTGPGYDGSLDAWDDIKGLHEWDALLIGNGLSINLWGDFDYASLFEQAKRGKNLTAEDGELFAKLGTENFERVLSGLRTTITVEQALGKPVDHLRDHERSVRRALAIAVKGVHITKGEIPDATLKAIRREMRNYRFVFTTSYDLIVYWSAGEGDPPRPFVDFCDFFWAHDVNAFDESTIHLNDADRRTRLFFLHGALHLVVMSDGSTRKRTAEARNLLDQFGQPHQDDDDARPLVITEADAEDKKTSITDNDYLSYSFRKLRGCGAPLVIFGHSLSEQDSHLIDALNEPGDRPIAVGIHDKGSKRNRSDKHRIHSLLEAPNLHFFNSASHPLGDENFALRETPWRKRILKKLKAA